MRLENKKALITGALRGIGKVIADLFIAEGAEVWGLDYKVPEDLSDRVEAAGGKLHWLTVDLSELAAVEAKIESAVKESGGFDVLVNNAGIIKDNLSFRMSLEEWQKVLDVNLSAAFLVARTVGRDMIRKRTGAIINMSSVVGIHGNGGQANYSASKAGLIGLTKTTASELGSRSITCNAVAPGPLESGMTETLSDEVKKGMLARIPLGRFGKMEEVAETVYFLAISKFITGEVIRVDGGLMLL